MGDGDACPACGSVNDCGMARGEASCWCYAMPHILPITASEEGGRCYCRACLTRVISDWMALAGRDRIDRRGDWPTTRRFGEG